MSTLLQLTHTLARQLNTHSLKLAVAESCTGGSLAAALTAISGSSQWFERGFVTYSNQAKKELLGVTKETLEIEGAVSEATVRSMAEGAIFHSDADISVAISGIAGPLGGTKDKPVGTVWIAFAGARQPTQAYVYTFQGSRIAIRKAAVIKALEGLIERTKNTIKPSKTNPRYFFALWPDETTQTQLAKQSAHITSATPCRPSLPKNFHLTLAYLGQLTAQECNRIKQLTHCAIPPFELKINKICQNTRHHFAYFSPMHADNLYALHRFLNYHLLAEGFKPEHRTLMPHITLARNYQNTLDTCLLNPIHWFVHELCLVESKPDTNTSNYEIIARTPLPLKTC